MKDQALFYQKNNEKYSRLSSAAVVIGALRIKIRRGNRNILGVMINISP